MFKLSFIAGIVLITMNAVGQSPHGKTLKTDCAQCHTTENWDVNFRKTSFNHNDTRFALKGQHKNVDCKNCHQTLIFSEAKSECADCHTDMHQQTVGDDCARCHNNNSWVVTNITKLHQESRFPLMGAHKTDDCAQCHKSVSNLQFEHFGIECFDCHKEKYYATTSPNHMQVGYSTNCSDCHSVTAFEWNADAFKHDFFPLVQGHSTASCIDCHGEPPFQKVASDCFSCHEFDYSNTKVPNHQLMGFSTECNTCHTLSPGWKPAKYLTHDAENFPIFSGKHKGEWDNCATCHTNESDYSTFTCLECHEHSQLKTNLEHAGRKDYKYESNSCLSCHPRGRKEDD